MPYTIVCSLVGLRGGWGAHKQSNVHKMMTQNQTYPNPKKRPLDEVSSDLSEPEDDKRNRIDEETDSDSDSSFDKFPGDTWPRFLVVESVDETNLISNISPFAIAKAIQGI